MRVLSLFSGGGLGDYGLTLAGMEIVGQVEIDDYCQKILKLRWPEVSKWRDIRDVKGEEVVEKCGRIDLISGGFPCQDLSYAKQEAEGIEGKRSGLWKEMFRLICEIRPRFVFVENVSALLGRGLGIVLGDLAEIGFDAEWSCIPASAVGAPHYRDRIWIVAYPRGELGTDRFILTKNSRDSFDGWKEAEKWGFDRVESEMGAKTLSGLGIKWKERPCGSFVCRISDGSPNKLDRLKLLGNGQVVQVVEWIGKRIMEHNTKKAVENE